MAGFPPATKHCHISWHDGAPDPRRPTRGTPPLPFSRDDAALAPDLVAPIHVQSDRLIVRALLEPEAVYPAARAVERWVSGAGYSTPGIRPSRRSRRPDHRPAYSSSRPPKGGRLRARPGRAPLPPEERTRRVRSRTLFLRITANVSRVAAGPV